MKFYCAVLGMQEQQRFDLGEGVQEVILGFPDSKGAGVILMWNTKRSTPYQYGDSYSRFVMMVSDLDAALAHLTAQGVTISKQPTDVGTLRYIMVKDPDGYTIEVLQLKRAATPAA
jgi:predicted enzyme related to lactoylglutathione lyase